MPKTLRLIATAFLAGALVTIPSFGAAASFPGQPTFAFLRQNTNGTRLFQMRPNGTEITPLGPWSDVNTFAVAMSPDGTRIVRATYVGLYTDLFVQQIGGGTKQITHTPDAHEWSPMWSPDGARIVYVEQDPADGSASIVTVRADGSGHRVVWSATHGNGYHPSWSPDGTRILLTAVSSAPGDPVVFDLATVRSDGTGRKWLTDTPANEIAGDWSPDGRRVAFVESAAVGPEIRLISMRATGGGRKLVSDRARIALMRPLYTPDGKRLVLGRYDTGVELVSIPVGGGVFKKITETDATYNAFDMLYLAG
jgi:Tol biopolymer transport system component